MKKIAKVILLLLLTMMVLIGVLITVLSQKIGKEKETLSYPEINMDKVSDGIYQGDANTTLVKASVEVTVEDNKIKAVTILSHENGRGSSAESIIEDMVIANNYQVDGVSGATMSSDVIKSAVAVALEKGVKE